MEQAVVAKTKSEPSFIELIFGFVRRHVIWTLYSGMLFGMGHFIALRLVGPFVYEHLIIKR